MEERSQEVDPELLEAFFEESTELITEMRGLMERFQREEGGAELFFDYAQRIDRIMGTAQTLGFDKIGAVCALGKIIGQQASKLDHPVLLSTVHAVFVDSLEVLEGMLQNVYQQQSHSTARLDLEGFVGRLEWLEKKMPRATTGSEEQLQKIEELLSVLKKSK